MNNFYNIKWVKIILYVLNLVKYIFWGGFLYFQGLSLQQAIEKKILLNQIIVTLGYFLITKLIVMLCDAVSKFVVHNYQNQTIFCNWQNKFPRKIYKDNENKYNLMYLKYFDYLPNLLRIECDIVNNFATIICVFLLIVSLLLYTGFYYGIAALFLIFVLNIFSKDIYLKKLNICSEEINNNKDDVSRWIGEYFKSYKEIFFNWDQAVDVRINDSYYNLYKAKKKYSELLFIRDLIAQFFVEIPFILNTSLVILGVYFNYINITQMFIWVGLSQFAINAANSFLQNNDNRIKQKSIINALSKIEHSFKEMVNKNPEMKACDKMIEVILQDSSVNKIGIHPGIYHIKGANGAGKTTLLNTVLGYERQLKSDNFNELIQFSCMLSTNNIRVIERDAIIFYNLDFNQQILGIDLARTMFYKPLLFVKLKYLFSSELSLSLQQKFVELEKKFCDSKHTGFSSGEKILVSLMRALISWDREVNILIIDECTLFLDKEVKTLFIRCIKELALRTAVYLSAHEIIEGIHQQEERNEM